jgi:uncharacterized protein (TIGR00251 family)
MDVRGAACAGAPAWFICGSGCVTLHVVARPGSSQRRILRLDPRGLTIALNSPPEKGQANSELADFLARLLKVPRSTIEIVRGASSRAKTVRIATDDPASLASALLALAPAASA